MSHAEERGALGKRFHDLPTDTDNPDLSWEAMAANVLSPTPPSEEEPEERKPLIWWWLTAILLLLGTGYYFINNDSQAEITASQEEVLVMTQDEEMSLTESISAQMKIPTTETSLQENGPAATRESATENTSPTVSNRSSLKREQSIAPARVKRSGPVLTNNDSEEDRVADAADVSPIVAGETPLTNEPPTAKAPAEREERVFSVISPLNAWPPQPLSVQNEMPVLVVQGTERDNATAKEKGKNMLSLTAGGFTQQSPYSSGPIPEAEVSQSSPQISLQYGKILSDKWQVNAGIDGRQYRFRTAFESRDENARLYRPGTVDTIFRNITTGEERVVLTDTIAGTRIRRFGHDNTVTELGLSLMLGRRWQFGRHGFQLSAGPRLGFVIGRNGRTTIQLHQVSDLAEAPQYGQDLRISGRLEADYRFNINQRWSFLAQFGVESSLSNWASGSSLQQKPTLLSGSLGIGINW